MLPDNAINMKNVAVKSEQLTHNIKYFVPVLEMNIRMRRTVSFFHHSSTATFLLKKLELH